MSEKIISNTGPIKLAIVIPAYKSRFFYKTLNSIANQTNKKFNLYIGDDNSPEDLKSIVDLFKDRINVFYTKFTDNIGAKNIVLQWQRCIELTNDERWLWLFSDDDLMDENCVENFYLTVKDKGERFDVFRFNTITIGAHENILFKIPFGPTEESSEQMAYYLLKGERGNSMPDHIFKRDTYTQNGGFVFTDYAQGADWATSILFSQPKGICIIPHSIVYWRYSGDNISSVASRKNSDMLNGHLQFIEWVSVHFEYLKNKPSNITYKMIMEALRINLKSVIISHYKGYHFKDIFKLTKIYHDFLKLSYCDSFIELIKIKLAFIPFLSKARRGIFKIKNLLFK